MVLPTTNRRIHPPGGKNRPSPRGQIKPSNSGFYRLPVAPRRLCTFGTSSSRRLGRWSERYPLSAASAPVTSPGRVERAHLRNYPLVIGVGSESPESIDRIGHVQNNRSECETADQEHSPHPTGKAECEARRGHQPQQVEGVQLVLGIIEPHLALVRLAHQLAVVAERATTRHGAWCAQRSGCAQRGGSTPEDRHRHQQDADAKPEAGNDDEGTRSRVVLGRASKASPKGHLATTPAARPSRTHMPRRLRPDRTGATLVSSTAAHLSPAPGREFPRRQGTRLRLAAARCSRSSAARMARSPRASTTRRHLRPGRVTGSGRLMRRGLRDQLATRRSAGPASSSGRGVGNGGWPPDLALR